MDALSTMDGKEIEASQIISISRSRWGAFTRGVVKGIGFQATELFKTWQGQSITVTWAGPKPQTRRWRGIDSEEM